jgi:hypothetical protein
MNVVARSGATLPNTLKVVARSSADGSMRPILQRVAAGAPAVVPAAGAASKILPTMGKVAKTGLRVGGYIIPWGLLLGGRLTQGLSTGLGSLLAGGGEAAGHLLNAAGALPSHLDTTSEMQRQRFGKTPTAALTGMIAEAGHGTGQALTSLTRGGGNLISATGNALGSTMADAGNTMRLADMQNSLNARRLLEAQQWKDLGLDPSTARVITQSMVGQR